MALKDWKKQKDTKKETVFITLNEWPPRVIEIDNFSFMDVEKPYQLAVNNTIKGHYKTKTEALKRARQYMRKH